ncbi:deoxyribonuclease IV [candidate division KSB1 bacterium]
MKKDILLGAHMSIAGGIDKAILRGEKIGCRTIQIFTKSPNQWKAKSLSKEEIQTFKNLYKKSSINHICAHTSYLINLASPEKDMYLKSVQSIQMEISRCVLLNIPFLVLHPGSTKGKDVTFGIRRVSDALNKVYSKKTENNVMICIETTAGQGDNIGYRFEHIKEIIERTEPQIGVCLDTSHIFAAGYDIRDKKTYTQTLNEFDKIIGMDKLKVIHLNDSKKELGSRKDRHEHVGKGHIGLQAFRLLMNDKRLKNIPKILETPKGPDMKEDIQNMKILLKLCK